MKRLTILVSLLLMLALPADAAFKGFLKKSTAVTIKFGPIVDATDGYTAETALTLHAAHIRLSKNGADFASKNSATAQVHDEYGYYDVALDTTDTGTLGILTVGWTDANSVVIVPQEYAVIDPNTWNPWFSTGELDVWTVRGVTPLATTNMRDAVRYQLNAAVTPADANANSVAINAYNLAHALTAQPATTVNTVTDATQFTLTAGSAVDDFYNQALVIVEDASDSNRRAVRIVRDYTGATKTIKCDEALPFLPAGSDPVFLFINRAVGRGRVSP